MPFTPRELLVEAGKLQRDGHLVEAIETLEEALTALPNEAEAWYQLGWCRKQIGQHEESLMAYAKALQHGVSRPEEAHLDRYVILTDHLRRDDEAERELEAALAIAPNYLPALLNLGNLREEQARREDALRIYQRARAVPADRGNAHDDLRHEALARSLQLQPPDAPHDPIFTEVEAATAAVSDRQPEVRANLQFAAGKALQKLGDDAAAFEAFSRANRHLLRTHGRRYQPAESERLFDAIIAAFPRVTAPARALPGSEGPQPLFICGMWRSGSTLLEQVLAAHPQVTAGGEVDLLLRWASSGPFAPYPASMARVGDAQVQMLAADYMAHLQKLFPETVTYITDKRPDNFLLIGLIKRLFPSAKILHTERDPMDVGLSIFMQHLNPAAVPYAADLRDIAHYLGQHARLMRHWKALYADDLMTVQYDALVREPEATVREVLEFVGLPWDEACLHFHELRNTVKTASYWQVRQPLYVEASGRWRRYAAQLAPLRAGLEEAGLCVSGIPGFSET